jgi:hypothetical protein
MTSATPAEAVTGKTMPEHTPWTPGPWEWWTSCSWKRLRSNLGGGKAVSVLEPYVCEDGHPDVSINNRDMALIAAAPLLAEALTEIADLTRFRMVLPSEGTVEKIHEIASAALAKARAGDTK